MMYFVGEEKVAL